MIYADHAATTPVFADIFSQMKPYFYDKFANASTQYKIGLTAKQAILKARKIIANCLSCNINEIYFTSGGSESNSWAILNLAMQSKSLLTTPIEHHSILNAVEGMKIFGLNTKFISVDRTGLINIDDFKNQIKNVGAVSVQYANNEVGTVQNINELAKICKENNILFHTDAVQAVGHIKLDLTNIDMLSASGHKFGAPKGIGFLYVKKGIKLRPLIYGGNQEFNMRGGTENTPNIIGMAYALQKSMQTLNDYQVKMKKIQDDFCKTLKAECPQVIFNGNFDNKLCGLVSVTIPNYSAEKLVYKLDIKGVCVSAGSACEQTGEVKASHVLKAVGLSYDNAICTVRFSFGITNDIDDGIKAAKYLIDILKEG